MTDTDPNLDDVCAVCGHARDDHQHGHGECLDDDCECIAFEQEGPPE